MCLCMMYAVSNREDYINPLESASCTLFISREKYIVLILSPKSHTVNTSNL